MAAINVPYRTLRNALWLAIPLLAGYCVFSQTSSQGSLGEALLWDGSPVADADLVSLSESTDGIIRVSVISDGKRSPVWDIEGPVFLGTSMKASSDSVDTLMNRPSFQDKPNISRFFVLYLMHSV